MEADRLYRRGAERMRVTQPILSAFRGYLKWSPSKRGSGVFLRSLATLNRLGFKMPIVKTQEHDLFYFHDKEVVLLDLLTKGIFEEEATNLLRQHTPRGGTFIDVGANLGYYSIAAARWVGDTGRVFAFEPIPRTRQILEQNIALNQCTNIEVLPFACSSKIGRARMVTGKDSGWSRLAQHSEGDTEVELITLDRFVEDHGLTSVDVLKVDVEGLDFEVIRGALQTIDRFRPVVLAEVEHTHNYGTSIAEIDQFFKAKRYSTRLIDDGYSRDMLCLPN